MMTIGEKIKALREYSGLKQSELASLIHNLETPSAISKWESNERAPSIYQLAELSKIFQVSADYIISEEEVFCKVQLLYIENKDAIPYKQLQRNLKKTLGDSCIVEISNTVPIWNCFVILYDETLDEFGIYKHDKIIIQRSDKYQTSQLLYFYNESDKKYYIRSLVDFEDGTKWLMAGNTVSPIEFNTKNIKIIGSVFSIIFS